MVISSKSPQRVSTKTPLQNEASRIEDIGARNLRDTGYHALESVSCSFHEGIMTLHGMVPSYYLKQIAVTTICKIPQVSRVIDRIKVVQPEQQRHPYEG